ncbi:Transposon Ty3-I Gag-Pol polyprotein [Vitis vinifera]|uniref:Transposon Ty3-I Gag-Pol polyprotein n=1 Tax=Vitis vinifera TaxID=29760 RepID=A0A438D6M4_VITVI|nr:Transposon Ty3-I Gag-Pol polyprotein [Vitis vinifera]
MGHSLTDLENPGRILSGFNGSSTISLGDIVLPVQAGPVTLNVQFSVVQELSPSISSWAHMATLHESHPLYISSNGEFPHQRGAIDLYGSQLAARQCYQIAREAGVNQEMHLPLNPALHMTNSNYWVRRTKIPRPVWQKISVFTRIDRKSSGMRSTNCSKPDSSEKFLSGWLANVVVFPLPRIDQIVDSTSGQGMLSFLDAFSGYHQIPMSPDDEEKTAFITPHGLYCYKVMPFGLKNAGATYQRL